MTRKEKKEELIGLFSTGAIYIGDLIDECFEFEQHHPHWISVEDELPKDDGIYLWYKAETQCVHMAPYWVDLAFTNKSITHWMYIPAPPEHIADVSNMIGSSGIPNNCKKLDMKGYENVVIHEGNAKGGVVEDGLLVV